MEEELKKKVVSLKDGGLSYSEIARTLSMNESTVKSVCFRSREDYSDRCLYCGKRLRQTRGHRQRKFCCDRCKDAYHNSRRKKP